MVRYSKERKFLNDKGGICMEEEKRRVAPFALHTHDRIAFKRCRRKWYFSSPLKLNLEAKQQDSINLWFGSGFHFAMEDYHGYHKFNLPEEALEAYYNAFTEQERPTGADDLIEIGMHMLRYYSEDWLPKHNFDGFETLWITPNPDVPLGTFSNHPIDETSAPQVEVGFTLELVELSQKAGFPVFYHGTFDRVLVDNQGRWWLLDYKTAKAIDMIKLATDPQIGAYLWAAEQWYQHKFEGIVYLQLVKDFPDTPKQLKAGGFSMDKRQKTTHGVYKAALLEKYGSIPSAYIPFLNELACMESTEGNRFIRWDLVRRNDASKVATYENILYEGLDMLRDDLYIYPNPTRDCSWDCPFRTICVAMDEGSDYQSIITEEFQRRNETMLGEEPEWRKKIKWPKKPIVNQEPIIEGEE